MFNPQTADWGKLALRCRKWHYNGQMAKKEKYPFIAMAFFVVLTEGEWEKRYGDPRTHL
jgi:hypothetical protein